MKSPLDIEDYVDSEIDSVLNEINRKKLCDSIIKRLSISKRATPDRINRISVDIKKFSDSVELSADEGEIDVVSPYTSITNKLIFGSDWFDGFGKVELAEFIALHLRD